MLTALNPVFLLGRPRSLISCKTYQTAHYQTPDATEQIIQLILSYLANHSLSSHYFALGSIHVPSHHHFALGHCKRTLSATFILSFYDQQNQVPHNRGTFIVLDLLPKPPTTKLGGGGKNTQVCQKVPQITPIHVLKLV